MPSSLTLKFDLSGTLALAEHAAAATAHEGYGGEEPAPALVWVRMNGTLLMSSGRPRSLPDVYAKGWGPGTGRALAQTPVGGDDFGLMIPVDSVLELSDGTAVTLLDWLRASHQGGCRWFLLDVTADSLGYAVE